MMTLRARIAAVASLVTCGSALAATNVIIQSATSPPAAHPSMAVPAAAGHKLVGGGALDNWTGNGSLLFSSRPQSSPTRWEAGGKDHFFADPTTITAFGMMLADSNNEYQVIVQEQTSAVSSTPMARATLPAGYVMTSGGCYANWQATPPRLGNLLTGSYPDETTRNAWICTSTDHLEASPAALTAYVVGIKPVDATRPLPTMQITKKTSSLEAHPKVSVNAPGADFVITGGGARADVATTFQIAQPAPQPFPSRVRPPGGYVVSTPQRSAQLLTASFPVGTQGSAATAWEARAKDHSVSSPGTVTAYAISLKFPPPPPPCACTDTGGFAAPQSNTISGGGTMGSFMHPTLGTFTITASLVSGSTQLTVRRGNSNVLSTSDVAAWGLSPGSGFFAVVHSPVGTNAGSPVTVYRVSQSSFPTIISTEVWPDGRWGFSGKGNQFIVTRSENKQVSGGVKIDFSLDAFNLLASNPSTAVLRYSELGSEGNTITVSPCGDRLMHFRWTQLNPQQGQANFYARKDYPSTQSVLADWDQVLVGGSAPTPTARAEMSGSSFIVRLINARLRSNAQTTFPSRQCEAP